MFRHRQHLRRWATRVLLLWLFGLGAGVANGCLAPVQTAPVAATAGPLVSAPHAADHASPHHHAPAAQAASTSTANDPPAHHGNLAKANCGDFCAKAAVSVPSLKSALDDVQSHAVTVMACVTVQPVLPEFEPALSWVPRRDGVQAPPIPIAFLRLAL